MNKQITKPLSIAAIVGFALVSFTGVAANASNSIDRVECSITQTLQCTKTFSVYSYQPQEFDLSSYLELNNGFIEGIEVTNTSGVSAKVAGDSRLVVTGATEGVHNVSVEVVVTNITGDANASTKDSVKHNIDIPVNVFKAPAADSYRPQIVDSAISVVPGGEKTINALASSNLDGGTVADFTITQENKIDGVSLAIDDKGELTVKAAKDAKVGSTIPADVHFNLESRAIVSVSPDGSTSSHSSNRAITTRVNVEVTANETVTYLPKVYGDKLTVEAGKTGKVNINANDDLNGGEASKFTLDKTSTAFGSVSVNNKGVLTVNAKANATPGTYKVVTGFDVQSIVEIQFPDGTKETFSSITDSYSSPVTIVILKPAVTLSKPPVSTDAPTTSNKPQKPAKELGTAVIDTGKGADKGKPVTTPTDDQKSEAGKPPVVVPQSTGTAKSAGDKSTKKQIRNVTKQSDKSTSLDGGKTGKTNNVNDAQQVEAIDESDNHGEAIAVAGANVGKQIFAIGVAFLGLGALAFSVIRIRSNRKTN